MTVFNKEIIFEKTIVIWLVTTTILTMLSLILAGVIVFAMNDCWPLTRYPVLDNICLAKLEPSYLKFIPILLGLFFGTVLTFKLSK